MEFHSYLDCNTDIMVNLDIIQITTFFEVQLPYPPYHTHEIEPIEEPNFISGYSSSIDPR